MTRRSLHLLCVAALGLGLVFCSGSSPSSTAQPATTAVHVGNLVEVGGSPGAVAVQVVAHLTGGSASAPVSISLPCFPWNGRTVAVVPLLPFTGVSSWTLTYQPADAGAPARAVSVVDAAPAGAPGTATLQLVDQLAGLPATLAAPADPVQASRYAQAVADLGVVTAGLRSLVLAAQVGPQEVGTYQGQPLSLDAGGLALLDRLAAGAQEPLVPSSATGRSALLASGAARGTDLTLSPGLAATGLAMGLAVGAAVLYAAPVALAVGTFTVVSLGGALVVGEALSQQVNDVTGSADPSGSDSAAATIGALAWGAVRSQLTGVLSTAGFLVTGPVQSDLVLSSRDRWPVHCDPARGNCLACNSIWNGYFPAGAQCCGSGVPTTVCYAGTTCDASCSGGPACLPPGGSCLGAATDGGSAGTGDGGPVPDGGADGGPADGGAPDGGIIPIGGGDGGDGGGGGGGSNACCACNFDVYCTAFGAGGCWRCSQSTYSGNVCQGVSGLVSPGACQCDPGLYQVCQ